MMDERWDLGDIAAAIFLALVVGLCALCAAGGIALGWVLWGRR